MNEVGYWEYKITFGEKLDSKYQYIFQYGDENSAGRFTFQAKDCDSDNSYTFTLPDQLAEIAINQKMMMYSFPVELNDAWRHDYFFDWKYGVSLNETGQILNQSVYYLPYEKATIAGLRPGEEFVKDNVTGTYAGNGYCKFELPISVDPLMIKAVRFSYKSPVIENGEEELLGYDWGDCARNIWELQCSDKELAIYMGTGLCENDYNNSVLRASQNGINWEITMTLINGATISFNSRIKAFAI